MKARLLFAASVTLISALCGCNQPEPPKVTVASTRPVADSPLARLSLDEARQMLNKELTVAQVKERLGKPVAESDQSWGNLMYRLADGNYLFFFFKGPYVTGARYGQTEVQGVSPTIHRLLVRNVRIGNKMSWHLAMGGRSFASLSELQKHVESLPRGSLVEYQVGCAHRNESEPLQTQADLDKLSRLCKDASVILLLYPGG